MQRLHFELQKLAKTWVVGEQEKKLRKIINQVADLGSIPASCRILDQRSTNQLLTLRCDSYRIGSGSLRKTYQDASLASVAACKALEETVAEFLQELEEIREDAYPLLWQLKQSKTEAVLNCLPEMAKSPVQLMQNIKDDCTSLTGGEGPTPFGRCKANTELFGSAADYSMQMLACLEMPEHSVVDVFSSRDSSDLINMVMQSRIRYVDACPQGPPPVVTADDVKTCLQQFSKDEYSCRLKHRWMVKALRVPEESQEDEAVLNGLFDTIVDDFFNELSFGTITLSQHGLATCALYRHLLIVHNTPKSKRFPMLLAPVVFR